LESKNLLIPGENLQDLATDGEVLSNVQKLVDNMSPEELEAAQQQVLQMIAANPDILTV